MSDWIINGLVAIFVGALVWIGWLLWWPLPKVPTEADEDAALDAIIAHPEEIPSDRQAAMAERAARRRKARQGGGDWT